MAWYMLTLVGKDRSGIVAGITRELFNHHCNLGEASMVRLGGNFSVMLMVQYEGSAESLDQHIAATARSLDLRHHIDVIEGDLLHHVDPDVQITVYGADRAGIVAEVTGALAEAGLNILNLETDVGGAPEHPIYVMQLVGTATQGLEVLQDALATLRGKGLEIKLEPIDVMLG